MQSIMGAPVFSRSSFTCVALILAVVVLIRNLSFYVRSALQHTTRDICPRGSENEESKNCVPLTGSPSWLSGSLAPLPRGFRSRRSAGSGLASPSTPLPSTSSIFESSPSSADGISGRGLRSVCSSPAAGRHIGHFLSVAAARLPQRSRRSSRRTGGWRAARHHCRGS